MVSVPATSTSTTKDAQFIRTFGGLGKGPGQLDCPHGLWVDTRGDAAVLVVADRSNQRLQRFTLDGKHIDFILGPSRLPCHFHERNGEVVIPDLWSKVVVLNRDNKLVATLGDGQYSQGDWNKIRTRERNTFLPGKFICPHSACFDHTGNIFVVEWRRGRQGYETSQSWVEKKRLALGVAAREWRPRSTQATIQTTQNRSFSFSALEPAADIAVCPT
jgi:hypothetical protein